VMKMYKVVIGLEVHCELNTNSKNFSSSRNEYTETPNIHVNEVDLGMPGILPVTNLVSVKKALKIALSLNCKVPDYVVFDRKNYYYADLPKGFQITQTRKPMGKDGYINIFTSTGDKKIEIEQIHLEEDTASMMHYRDYSLIDYNRAGVPLIEVVTKPCLNSADDAYGFLEALRSLFIYTEVSEARLDRGEMRCDVNISLMKEDATEFGTKVEIKNIGSFVNVKHAIEYEILRQTDVLNSGYKVVQETRRFDEREMKTFSMRSKVDSVDYKYFIEPNLPPFKLEKEYIDFVKKEIPVLQYDRYKKYIKDYGLSEVDSKTLNKEKKLGDYFENLISLGITPNDAATWVVTTIIGTLNKLNLEIDNLFLTPKMLSELIKMVSNDGISFSKAKNIVYESIREGKDPVVIIKEANITQINDIDILSNYIEQSIEENVSAISDYKSGKNYVINFIVGQVMKKTKGQANPSVTTNLVTEILNKK
jgi:aspartyl-tRNA(Asn)/glutamyl-tRNA(Gln) amidotransferase subunit B